MSTLRRTAAGAAALLLTVSMAACSKDSSEDSSSSSQAGGSSQAAGGDAGAAGGQPGENQGGNQNGSQNGGSTPKEAVQNLFKAMSTDNGDLACRQMVAEVQGKKVVVADDPSQLAACKTNTEEGLKSLPAEQKMALGMVQVTHATENGDTAEVSGKDLQAAGRTMEDVITSPLKLAKVNGRWYVEVQSMFALADSAGASGGASIGGH